MLSTKHHCCRFEPFHFREHGEEGRKILESFLDMKKMLKKDNSPAKSLLGLM